MVWMFWKWDLKQVGHFGTVLTMGVGLFVFNLVRTLRRVPRWNVTATAITASLFWISLTVIAGLSIATGKCTFESTSGLATVGGVKALVSGLRSLAGFMSHFDAISAMHAHAHLGGVGFFNLLIVGASYKLIPMFTLSEVQNQCRAGLSIVLLNIGLVGSFVTILLRSPWKLAFAIMGMLYKIIPFLVWFGFYGRHVGRARVPVLVDMYSPRLQMVGYWSFLAGLVTISAGILRESESGVRFGSLLFFTSVGMLVLNVGKILVHVVRPQITTQKLPTVAAKANV